MGADKVPDTFFDNPTYDRFETLVSDIAAQDERGRDEVAADLYREIEDRVPQRRLPRDEYEEAVDDLVDQASDYDPDAVVGINRGGNPLATALSYRLDVSYGTVDATHYDGKQQLDEVSIDGEMLHNVEGDVLLADNLADTGKTLEAVRKELDGRDDIDQIRTATLHRKPHSQVTPDYYVDDVIAWIVYPWED